MHDFCQSVRAKNLILGIRDVRNRRAHDNPISARENYRLSDMAQQFFEATPYSEISVQF